MTEKQKSALEKILGAIPESSREVIREIAEHAVSLGYMPVLKGASSEYVDFYKSRVKKLLLKIDTDSMKRTGEPRVAIKFFACETYSDVFKRAIENRIDLLMKVHNIKGGCYGCGRCDGTHVYRTLYPDGAENFLCGNAVIDLPYVNAEILPEIKSLLKAQDDFFMDELKR